MAGIWWEAELENLGDGGGGCTGAVACRKVAGGRLVRSDEFSDLSCSITDSLLQLVGGKGLPKGLDAKAEK